MNLGVIGTGSGPMGLRQVSFGDAGSVHGKKEVLAFVLVTQRQVRLKAGEKKRTRLEFTRAGT